MKSREITSVALMIALLIALGFVPAIPLVLLPSPIVVQNIGIMLAGLFLGKRNGMLAVLLFLLLVAVGLPILAGGRGGIAVFVGPTAGYLLGYPISAFLIGWRFESVEQKNIVWWKTFLILVICGVFVIDFLGVLGMMVFAKISFQAGIIGSLLVYLPGDILKAAIVATVYQMKFRNRIAN